MDNISHAYFIYYIWTSYKPGLSTSSTSCEIAIFMSIPYIAR